METAEQAEASMEEAREEVEDVWNCDLLTNVCKEASKSFFSEFGLISHQINSYNDFLENGIERVFSTVEEINIQPGSIPTKDGQDSETRGARIKFGNIKLEKPMFCIGEVGDVVGDRRKKTVREKKYQKLLPRHARLQHMSYSATITADIEVQVYTLESGKGLKYKTGEEQLIERDVTTEVHSDVVVGQVPVMVRSNLCWMKGSKQQDCEFDYGGYFLVNGAEKVFIAQEQVCLNRLWVSNQPHWNVSYRAAAKRVKINIEELNSYGKKMLSVHFMSCKIPLWILFFALGMSSDKDIIEMIDANLSDSRIDNILFFTMEYTDEHFEGFRNRRYCVRKIDELMSQSKFPAKESAKEGLEKLFPNLRSLKQKAVFVGYMVKCLLESYAGERKCESRDDFKNKRLDLASELLERELQVHLKHSQRRMVRAIQKDLYGNRSLRPIDYYLDDSIISCGVSKAFSTGQWSHQYKMAERVPGVVATLRRTNALQIMTDMRKTRQNVQYAGKVGGARFPHPSHRGRLCYLSTNDGENCGLVKNLAITGLVSTNLGEPPLEMLLECGMEKLAEYPSPGSLKGKFKVFCNGEWLGICEDSLSFVQILRSKRRSTEISPQVEIKRDLQQREVRMFSDSGRIMRPLLVVENLERIKECEGDYNIHSLLDKGIIEFVGVEEEEDCQTAWGVRFLFLGHQGYTHCELDPSFLLGLSCGIIPFPNHDQAKRVLYQSEKHSQQAIGISTTNPDIRADTLSHRMYYPQRPLFHTMLSDCLEKPEYDLRPNVYQRQQPNQGLPRPEIYNGQNAIVAVNVHQGYNQEDSLVMNRASIERGMFRTEHIRNYKTEVFNNETRRQPKDRVYFGKTSTKTKRNEKQSQKLDEDGFPHVGLQMDSGDVIFGRCTETGEDRSIRLKHSEKGSVQSVILSANDEGKNFAAVSLRQVKSPSVGDKFSSMHGQKGVIGFLDSQENFPFTCQGIVPDIVINPHAFPTRQTTGQLLEAALGKGIASGGMTRYATPFSTPSVEVITEQLHRAGYSRWGRDRVCSGRHGDMMDSMIFIGPTFYQRLTMMSDDQLKFRSTGPVNPYTRQPVKDRKRFGGIKFGDMERDCILAHGAAANVYERLLTLSDLSVMYFCHKCSKVATITHIQVSGGGKASKYYCKFCESAKDIVKVNMPYGAMMLYQELFSMGISIDFQTEIC